MSLQDLVTKFNMKIDGVLHVGAHLGEEASTYSEMGIERVVWVEGNPLVIGKLAANLKPYGQEYIQALVYSKEGDVIDFHVTNYDGMSSSILEFGTHPTFSPDTVFEHTLLLKTRTIDSLAIEYAVTANFLNMDLQGAELHALQGATQFLGKVEYIMTEVNKAEVYVGCARVEQLDDFLHEFERVETYWVPEQGWGDALYIRRALR